VEEDCEKILVQKHVVDGKKVLNFSLRDGYSKEEKIKILEALPKSLTIRMPPIDYLWLHENSKLSDEDKKKLSRWVEKLIGNLN